MGRMDGKVALVSGGAEGIGGCVAEMFVSEGGSVMIGDIQVEKAKSLAERLGDHAAAIQLDVRSLSLWEDAVEATLNRFGKVTTLCNIAGISEPGNVTDIELESWQRTLDINLGGTFNGCRAALPALESSGQPGSIVNIGSMLALRVGGEFSAYCASKAAVTALTKTIALDCAARGSDVRANIVHPGAIRTPMFERYAATGPSYEEMEALFAANHPVGRIGEAEEVAKAVLFLTSDESSFTTGAELTVDGAGSIRE